VLFFNFFYLPSYLFKVVMIFFKTVWILGSDIGFTKDHKIINEISCIKDKPSHCGVSYIFIGYDNGSAAHQHELLYIFHFLVERHAQLLEKLIYHFGSHELMTMKGPAYFFMKFLCWCFTNIVKQGGPS